MVNQEMLQLGTERSVIRELFEFGKARAQEIGAENVFDFSIGNPNTPPPALVDQLATSLLQEPNIHGYTSAPGDPEAREKLAQNLSEKAGRSYAGENLYLTVGAAAALCCCIRGLATKEQDEFLVFAPYFPEYQVFIQSNGGKCLLLPALEGFQPNLQALEQQLSPKTCAVLVNSPNNPSGVIYQPDSLEKLGELLRKKSLEYGHPIYLISDEPYRELVYDEETVPWMADFYANTLVCYSFSKSLSLAGERLGYVLIGAHVEDWQQVYGAVAGAGRSLGYVNAPSLFQRITAGCCHLTADLEFYQENRNLLRLALESEGFSVPKGGGAFYLFPQSLEPDDVAFCQRAQDFDLLLVPGSAFGAPGYFRLAYCVSRDKVTGSFPKWKALAKSYGPG